MGHGAEVARCRACRVASRAKGLSEVRLEVLNRSQPLTLSDVF